MPALESTAVTSQIETMIRERFKVSADDKDFTRDVHLFDYGYLDSFSAAELISAVEGAFGIHFTDAELIKYPLNTINEISAFVIRKAGS
jgi:methoxymalonate biosynthesis acyl carrier protein